MVVEYGKHFFPSVFFRRTVESRQHEHQDFRAHAYRQQHIAAGQVQNFEQRAPDDDGSADGVGEIEEALPLLAGYECGYAAFVLLNFSHDIYFLICFWPLAKPICVRTQRKPMYERCSFWYSHMRRSERMLWATSFQEPPRTILRFILYGSSTAAS